MKPVAVLITDDHCSDKSAALVIDIHRQARDKAKELGLTRVYHGGDLIDSRKHQSLTVLKAIVQICDEYEDEGMELYIIPGNHSKPDYDSEESFLDIFDRYPAFKLVRTHACFTHGDIVIHMVPFFSEKEVYPQYLKKAIIATKEFKSSKHLLITHVAVNGVMNNDGSEIDNELIFSKFKVFDKVLIGHYHNKQQFDNIVYVGSTHQHNFGEDEDKGLTVIYDDLSLEQIKLNVPVYKTTVINLNEENITDEKIEELIESSDYERVKFTGTKDKLASIETISRKMEAQGIKIERDEDDPEIDMSYTELKEFKGFNEQTILDEWDDFADKRELDKQDKQDAKERLEQILTQ